MGNEPGYNRCNRSGAWNRDRCSSRLILDFLQMNTHDIELPAEYRSGNSIPVERATITRERMTEILQDAIEADRQRRGEPYNPRKPTEEEWRRLTENGRRAWGNHPAVPEKEPPCDT